MRILHTRTDAFCAATLEGQFEPQPETDPQGDCWEYLPMHRLSEYIQSYRNGRGKNAGHRPWRLNLAGTLKWRALRKKCMTSLPPHISSPLYCRTFKALTFRMRVIWRGR